MDYKKIYDNLIKFCKKRKNPDNVYIELHHIIPESLGGETNKENLVELTLREHYFAHELLVRIYPNENKLKYALWMMTVTTMSAIKYKSCHRGKRISDLNEFDKEITISARQYEYAKEQYILGKNTKIYSKTERKNVSIGTIKGMKTKNAILACSKGSKGTKWYRNKETGQTFKWFPGDKMIDLSVYEWGRGNYFTKEMKDKVSVGKKYPKTWYSLVDTDIVVLYPNDAIKKLNNNWKIIKQGNKTIKDKSVKSILCKILRNFNIKTDFKYDRNLNIYQNKRLGVHKNQVVPGVYEILKEIGILSKDDLILNEEKIINALIEKIDVILKSNKEYLTFKEL